MKELEFNAPMTVGRMKEALKNIPDDVAFNVLNAEGKATANIYVWFEDLDTRQFVELMGFKPFYEMTKEEKEKCGVT
jgi:hypothetical protein